MSETEVFSVNCDDQFKEEDSEVVEDDFIFFGRRWWRGFSRDCRRNLRCSNRNSRNGSRSRRVQGCGNVFCGVYVSDYGGVWFFCQLWRVAQSFGGRGFVSSVLVT